jgi:hypothetical protein
MIYFCSENYLKQIGIINDNVDATAFMPLVQFASAAFIKKQLGSIFYQDLLTKYNDQTLDANEIIIVEYIQPAVCWRAVANAGVSLTYGLFNKGYQKQTGEQSTNVDLKEVQFMYDHYIQQAFYFENELKTYLIANKDLYPLFMSADNIDSSIKNSCCNGGGNNYNEGVGFLLI